MCCYCFFLYHSCLALALSNSYPRFTSLLMDGQVANLQGLKTPANKRKEKQEGEVEGAPRLIGEATRFHKPG